MVFYLDFTHAILPRLSREGYTTCIGCIEIHAYGRQVTSLNPSLGITGDPRNVVFYLTLTLIIDSYDLNRKSMYKRKKSQIGEDQF